MDIPAILQYRNAASYSRGNGNKHPHSNPQEYFGEEKAEI